MQTFVFFITSDQNKAGQDVMTIATNGRLLAELPRTKPFGEIFGHWLAKRGNGVLSCLASKVRPEFPRIDRDYHQWARRSLELAPTMGIQFLAMPRKTDGSFMNERALAVTDLLNT